MEDELYRKQKINSSSDTARRTEQKFLTEQKTNEVTKFQLLSNKEDT